MARGGVAQLAGVRVERQEDGGRHAAVGDVHGQAPCDLAGRRVLVRERAKRIAQLSHQHRRLDSPPCHVSDREVEDSVGSPNSVVPVAADLEPDATGVVPARELEAVDDGERIRQQAPLECDGDVVLVLVASSARESSGRLVDVRDDERLVGIVEGLVCRENECCRADRASALGEQRQSEERSRRGAGGSPDRWSTS